MIAALLVAAERCEQITDKWYNAPFDADIYEALGYSVIRGGSRVCWRYRGHGPFGFESHWVKMQSFTYELNAALDLVPGGALWEVEHKINVGASETFERPKGEPERDFRAGVGVGDVPARWTHGRSFTSPALALCAAALRARAQVLA